MPRRKNPAAVALGRRGGKARTKKKAESSRRNGQMFGGRPPKFDAGDVVVGAARAPKDYRGARGVVLRPGSVRSSFIVAFAVGEAQVRSWMLDRAR